MFRSIALAWLAVPALGSASPVLTHQGRLLDAGGAPIHGAATLRIDLLDTAGSLPFWTRAYPNTPIDNGYYAVPLVTDDAGNPLDVADFEDGEVWVQVSVGGNALGDPERLNATPFALLAMGVVLPTSAGGACEVAGALAFDGTSAVLVCDGDNYVSIAASGTSGPEHVALNNHQFFSSGDVLALGWSCTSPSGAYSAYNGVGYMHLHNGAYYECHRGVDGLIPGRQYLLSYRRSYDNQNVFVREVNAAGSVVGNLHASSYDSFALNTNRGYNVLTQVLFDAPASGRVQVYFDQSPGFTNAGQNRIDLRTNTPPTAPHTIYNNWSPASHDDVYESGWDSAVPSPGNAGRLWHHNGHAEYRLSRFDQVVPGETYSVSYTKYNGAGRFSVYAASTTDNTTSTLLGRSTDANGDGIARSFTFVAPANGWVKMVMESPTLENYSLAGLSIATQ